MKTIYRLPEPELLDFAIKWLGWETGSPAQVRMVLESMANISKSAIYDDWTDREMVQECLIKLGAHECLKN